MGPNNAFYLDASILPVYYKNLFGIAFNSSSDILISSNKKVQNIAVFIVPSKNCQYHSFYGMSQDDFQISLNTKVKNDNIQACGFFPSFTTDIYQNVTFGINSKMKSNSHIFYGFNDQLSHVDFITKSNAMIHVNNNLNDISQELNNYLEFKKMYRKRKKQKTLAKDQKEYISSRQPKKLDGYDELVNKMKLEKDEEEEKFFKQYYHKYLDSVKNNDRRLFQKYLVKNSIHDSSNFVSPGFLFSSSTTSIRSLNSVDTEFYVIYNLSNASSSSEIILNRKFIGNQDYVDNSMLTMHYDYILYYDKVSMSFIYDNNWTIDDSTDVIQKSFFWKIMKWFLALIIIVFSIIIVFIVVSVLNYSKKNKLCCFKNKNLDREINEDEYNLNIEYPNVNRRRSRHRQVFDPNNINESELETICYTPNLDDQITYKNYNTTKKKSKSKSVKNYSNYDSDSFNYEYDYEYSYESDDVDNEVSRDNSANRRNLSHKKKRVKRKKNNFSSVSISNSPYSIDAQNNINNDDISLDNLESIDNQQEDVGESILNPYGLPSMEHNPNEVNEDEFSTHY